MYIVYIYTYMKKYVTTTCRPLKERCISDIVLKSEGSMVRTCRNIKYKCACS